MNKSSRDNRKHDRLRCRLNGMLYFINEVIEVQVIDVSRTGLCVSLKGWISATPGANIKIRTSELGMTEGTVRWYRSGKMGVHLAETSNTAAQIASYLRLVQKPSAVSQQFQTSLRLKPAATA